MGIGLAQSLAQADLFVLLVDINDDVLRRAKRQIGRNTRLSSLQTLEAEFDAGEILARITLTTDYRTLESADFVIENVTEKWPIKEAVYKKLDSLCPPRTVFAANTSVIPVTRIASATSRPAKVIGMHFMNPAPLKRTVEVIRGRNTSPETIAEARSLLNRMGKECVVVNDSPGFVTNRVLMPTINEAIFVVHERIASVEETDRLFRECFGHKMGPLETADLIGLDTVLLSIEALYESFSDSKYRPCPLLRQMVEAGLLGRKSGAGFYCY